MTEQSTPVTQSAKGTAVPAGVSGGTAVVGPFTIRDLAVLGAVAIIFIGSLIPLLITPAGSFNLWNTTNLFYVGIGMVLPLATGALFVIRRVSPTTTLRLGSLSLDQFASVVAVFAAFFFFAGTVTNFRIAYLVGLIGAVLFVVVTTCALWIPALAADFAGRAETPAHLVARDAVAPVQRPAAPKPVVAVATASPDTQSPAAPVTSAPSESEAAPAAAGWSSARPASVHTPAGQIFTPANEDRQTASAAGAAAAKTPTVGAAAATDTNATATNAADTEKAGLHSAAAAKAEPVTDAAADSTAAEPVNHASTQAVNAVEPARSAQETATTVNPQLVESAKPEASTTPAVQASAPEKDASTPAPGKESITATVDPKAGVPAVIAEPFWFAVDRPQNVIDEKTRQFIYKLTPGSWILALEDRGNSFLVQDGHGKTGLLLDLVGIERASDSQ